MSEPVPVRDAATVVLLRDGANGVETFLLTRVPQMAFAPGMTVFPGGRVEQSDAAVPMTDAAPVAARLGCPEATARALVGAAARETFEETSVLLTVPPPGSALSGDRLAAARADVEGGRSRFADLLEAAGLAVDATALRPWSRWVTPAGEVRRYDARFFVCALPDRGEALHVTGEASRSAWVPVGAAIEAAQRGELELLPPTATTLASLLEYGTVAEVLDAAAVQSLAPVRPQLVRGPDGAPSVVLPDGRTVAIPRAMLP